MIAVHTSTSSSTDQPSNEECPLRLFSTVPNRSLCRVLGVWTVTQGHSTNVRKKERDSIFGMCFTDLSFFLFFSNTEIAFYLVMNVAVGGTNGWFPDGAGDKPWLDGSFSEYLLSFPLTSTAC